MNEAGAKSGTAKNKTALRLGRNPVCLGARLATAATTSDRPTVRPTAVQRNGLARASRGGDGGGGGRFPQPPQVKLMLPFPSSLPLSLLLHPARGCIPQHTGIHTLGSVFILLSYCNEGAHVKQCPTIINNYKA